MSICEEYDIWLNSVQQDTVDVSKLRTAIFLYQFNSKLPTYLFVHGIGGNHLGLVPLAYELREEMNMVFVDLPGHGQSEMPIEQTLERLREWAEQLIESLEGRHITVDGIVAHSFGCFVAQYLKADIIFLCNPPFEFTPTTVLYTNLIYNMRYLLRNVYEAYIFAMFRGLWMLYDRSYVAIQRLEWMTKKVKVSTDQYLYHAVLGKAMIDRCVDTTNLHKLRNLFIISSQHDKVTGTPKDLEGVLVNAKFMYVSSDHVSVVEAPKVMAGLIMGAIGTKALAQ